MLVKTEGIVLRKIKFSDSKFICHIHTRELGRKAYLVYGKSGKKQQNHANLLRPVSLLEMEVYQKNNRDLQKLKSFGLSEPLPGIYSDYIKNMVSLFLAEFLYKSVEPDEQDPLFFDFIKNALILFDSSSNISNFHIAFLLKAGRFFGINPQLNYSDSKRIFDIINGKFITGHPAHDKFCSEKDSEKLFRMLSLPLSKSDEIIMNKNTRNRLLSNILEFYNYHIDRPGKMKSAKVLQAVLSPE